MKYSTLLLTFLASLPLSACTMATAEMESGEEAASSTTEPLFYVANPAPTVIDFDFDPSRFPIADGTIVDTTYASFGVTFNCIFCSSGHAFARVPGRTGNAVSLRPSPIDNYYDARDGAVRAEFSTPRKWVSIDVFAIIPPEYKRLPYARPWLEAVDEANNMIGPTIYYPAYGTPGDGQWQTLRIDDPKGRIKAVRFSSQHLSTSASVYGVFDNLRFNTDPYWAEIKTLSPPVQLPTYPQPLP